MSQENPYAAPNAEVQLPPVYDSIPGPHNYASLGERFLGSLIDGIVMVVIAVVAYVVMIQLFISESMADLGFVEKMAELDEIGATVIALVMTAVYMAVQWTFWQGSSQSIGKKVMKTQIVNLDGTRADIMTIAFKRFLVISMLGLIPRVGDWVGIVDVLMIFRKERNCLHDDIAKTRVIKLAAPPQ